MENEDAIVIVGMYFNAASANDAHDFPQMLRAGKSQHACLRPQLAAFISAAQRRGKRNLG